MANFTPLTIETKRDRLLKMESSLLNGNDIHFTEIQSAIDNSYLVIKFDVFFEYHFTRMGDKRGDTSEVNFHCESLDMPKDRYDVRRLQQHAFLPCGEDQWHDMVLSSAQRDITFASLSFTLYGHSEQKLTIRSMRTEMTVVPKQVQTPSQSGDQLSSSTIGNSETDDNERDPRLDRTSRKSRAILFLAADPSDASRLQLGKEVREIQEKLNLAKLRERFALHQRMSVRPEDISQALLDIQPQIVHFSGHGMAEGALCIENQIGETQPIHPDALAALFEQFADHIQCIVLNACYSEVQANAIAKYISFVIGMSQVIDDRAAIAFSIGFYQALGAGRMIEEAYKLGCVQIWLQGIPGHLTPVLIKKG